MVLQLSLIHIFSPFLNDTVMESRVGSVATALKVGLVLCVRPSAGENCEIMGSSSGVVKAVSYTHLDNDLDSLYSVDLVFEPEGDRIKPAAITIALAFADVYKRQRFSLPIKSPMCR